MKSRNENPQEQDLIKRYTSTNDISAIPITYYDDDNGIDRANCVAGHVDNTTTNTNATATSTAIETRTQVDHYHPYFPLKYFHPYPSLGRNSYYYFFEQRVRSTSINNHLHYPPPPPLIDDNMAPFDDNTLANNINRSNNNLPAINTNVNTTQQEDKSGMKRTNNDFQQPPFYDSDNNYDFISSTATTPQQSNQASSSGKSKTATEERKEYRAKGQNSKAIATPDRQLPLVNSYREEEYDNNEYYHHGHDHGYYPYNYQYLHHAPYSYPPATTSSSKVDSKNDNNSNNDYRNDDRSTWKQQDQQLANSHSSVYCKSGWYPQYPFQQDQDQQQAYSPENYRHYMSPSPPPPPPPYSDYYYECRLPHSDGTSHDGSSPFPHSDMVSPYYSQYGHSYHPSTSGDYSNNWEQHQHQHHHYHHQKEQTKETKAIASSPETPLARPSEKKKKKNIPKVTPLSNFCGRRLSPSTKITINLPSSKIIIKPPTSGESKSASALTASTPFVTLRNTDIVCGRGAPTNYHIGNEMFRELVTNYHTSYFCAKRSEKPQIAMKVLDVLQSRSARFVRRQKGGRCPTSTVSEKTKKRKDGKVSLSSPQPSKLSYWVEVPHKLAYEKVCQALRDGAPQVQHRILSTTRTIQQSLLSEQSKSQKAIQQQHPRHHQEEQQQQYHSNNNTQECHLRGTGAKNGPTADQGKENGLLK